MSSEVGAPSGAAAIGFSSYALMMIAGRLLGDSVVRAIGRTRRRKEENPELAGFGPLGLEL